MVVQLHTDRDEARYAPNALSGWRFAEGRLYYFRSKRASTSADSSFESPKIRLLCFTDRHADNGLAGMDRVEGQRQPLLEH